MYRSSLRDCDGRLPSQLNLTGFTHLNFGETRIFIEVKCSECWQSKAFAFFDPKTFEVIGMDYNADYNAQALFAQFTALKQLKP
jgi:hypothetical protein